MKSVIGAIAEERARQDKKWGEQNHGFDRWYKILGEELGEACRASLEADAAQGEKLSAVLRRAEHLCNMRVELIQAAALLVAMIECGDRNEWWPNE